MGIITSLYAKKLEKQVEERRRELFEKAALEEFEKNSGSSKVKNQVFADELEPESQRIKNRVSVDELDCEYK